MKVTTRMFLGSALSAVLLSTSVLAADGGGETPGPAVTPQRSGPIEQQAQSSSPREHMRLDDGQLDAVNAGQLLVLEPLPGVLPPVEVADPTGGTLEGLLGGG
jgi:hypothetical protein